MFKFGICCLSVCLIACMLLAGCAVTTSTSGRPIRDDQVAKIVKGQTTVDDVIEILGSPQGHTEVSGEILYTYRYTQVKGSAFSIGYFTSSGGHETSDELTIVFDKASGKVKTCSLQRGIQS